MGLGTIITMGVIGFGGSLLSSLLYTQGEAKKAQCATCCNMKSVA